MTSLQLARQAVGLSQSELAKKSGVPLRTLQALEIGARDINKSSVITVYKLAKAIGCPIEEIMEDEEEEW